MSAGKLTKRNVGQSGRVHARILDANQWLAVSAPKPGKKPVSWACSFASQQRAGCVELGLLCIMAR